jgi:hypothetical protein
MATETVTLDRFATGDELCGLPAGYQGPTALQFNPEAPPIALLAAALSRVDRLQKALDSLAVLNHGDLSDFASVLEPLAAEAQLLMARLDDTMRKAARTSGE